MPCNSFRSGLIDWQDGFGFFSWLCRLQPPLIFLRLLARCCRNRLHKCSRMLVLSRWRSTTCLAVLLPSTPALNYPLRRDLVPDKYMYSAGTHQCSSLVEDDNLSFSLFEYFFHFILTSCNTDYPENSRILRFIAHDHTILQDHTWCPLLHR